MSYYIYKESEDILHCNKCHAEIKRNKHGKLPKSCPECQARLKKNPSEKLSKAIVSAKPCPSCKHSPTLLTATDYAFMDGANAHHRIACLNCGKVKTNIHYSLEGVEAEWNDIVNKSEVSP